MPGHAALGNLQRPSTLWAGDDEHGALAAADAGLEVLADLLKPVRARTLTCSGAEFKRHREQARSGNRRSIFCLPVGNPLGKLSTIW